MNTEHTILSHLISNETYGRRVLPFLKDEYFQDAADRILFTLAKNYVDKYNTFPTKEALLIDANNLKTIKEDHFKSVKSKIANLYADPETDIEWLLDQTEKFCQDKAVYNGIMKSIQILDDNTKFDKGAIPKILQDALSVSFDTHIGHDFLEDWELRYELYHKIENKIPFDIEYLNEITKGGFSKKTLNVILGGTGVGKTLIMCHMAAANLSLGKNVLYITLEMGEAGSPSISERIDANLLNVDVNDLIHLPKKQYESLIGGIQQRTQGKLIIKEYPAASANVNHFRFLLEELKLKKTFVPDIIYIDYLNLCISSRVKLSGDSYGYIKAIAEELKGLGSEYELPIVSASQLNRTGFSNSDADLTHTSESFGLPMTADFMMVAISTDELLNLNQYMFKQLKNRYNGITYLPKFVVGVDRPKMRLYDVEKSAQTLIPDDPVFDAGLQFDMDKFKDFT